MSTRTPTNLKAEAHQLIDELPETATWDDLLYLVQLHAKVQRGIADAEAGRTISHEEMGRRLGLVD